MKLPFVCFNCEKEKIVETDKTKIPCDCGSEMEVDYQDNYEKDLDSTVCNTCIHNRVGDGEKCNSCNNV